MMLENQRFDLIAVQVYRSGNPDETDHGTVLCRLIEQRTKLLSGVEPMLLQVNGDAHPPETGARNSTSSVASTR